MIYVRNVQFWKSFVKIAKKSIKFLQNDTKTAQTAKTAPPARYNFVEFHGGLKTATKTAHHPIFKTEPPP